MEKNKLNRNLKSWYINTNEKTNCLVVTGKKFDHNGPGSFFGIIEE
jgi:hypothetical protein